MSTLTVQDAWYFYRTTVLSFTKNRSQVTEEGRWNHYIAPVLSNRKLCDLTKADYLYLRRHIESKGLSPQTVRHGLSLLRRILNVAIEYELYVGKNIPNFKKILPRYDNRRTRFLTIEEAQLLFSYLKQSEIWYDISMVALNTGLRRGEIFNIEYNHIDFNNRLLNVVDTKSGINRIIPLNNQSYTILLKKNEFCT